MQNLVIIPAGKASLHQQWRERHQPYGFDLCLLNYAPEHQFEDLNSLNARYHQRAEGMKFKLVSAFYQQHPDALEQYRYTLLMDDDIQTSPAELQKFFEVVAEYDFDLCQPALSEGSYFSYFPTQQIRGALYHTTNTVEVMMPCFSRRLLRESLGDLEACKQGYGWGLEAVWERKFHRGVGQSKFGGQIGVIDCVEFGHFRPVGGHTSGIYELFGPPLEDWKIYREQLQEDPGNVKFVCYDIVWQRS